MTKNEMKTQFDGLGLFYEIKLSKKYPIYYSVLQNYEVNDLKKAIAHIIKTISNVYQNYNFLPDILNFISPKIDKSNIERILFKLQSKILVYGRYSTPKLDNLQSQIIHDIGGWVNACMMSRDDFKWAVLNLVKEGYELRDEPVKKHLGMFDKPKLQGFKNMQQLTETIKSEFTDN